MTFTYDHTLPDELSVLRFELGDSIESKGCRPNERNFSDEELTAVLTRYGSVLANTLANLFGVLVAEWSAYAVSFTVGPRKEELYRIVEAFQKKQREWEEAAGLSHSTFVSGFYRAGSRENSEFN